MDRKRSDSIAGKTDLVHIVLSKSLIQNLTPQKICYEAINVHIQREILIISHILLN